MKWLINLIMRILYKKRTDCTESLTQGLIAYYKLNDSTNTIEDSIGTNDFTNVGGTLGATGILNNCVSFDGTSGKYISGTSAYAHQTYDDVTVSLWVKLNTVTGAQRIYQDAAVLGASPLHVGFNILANTDDLQVGWQTYNNGGVQTWTNALAINTWYNITLTINRSAGSFTSYLNGSHWGGTATTMGLTPDEFAASTTIGRVAGVDTQWVNGYIDDVKIWNRALTLCEVSANYNGGSGIEL